MSDYNHCNRCDAELFKHENEVDIGVGFQTYITEYECPNCGIFVACTGCGIPVDGRSHMTWCETLKQLDRTTLLD